MNHNNNGNNNNEPVVGQVLHRICMQTQLLAVALNSLLTRCISRTLGMLIRACPQATPGLEPCRPITLCGDTSLRFREIPLAMGTRVLVETCCHCIN